MFNKRHKEPSCAFNKDKNKKQKQKSALSFGEISSAPNVGSEQLWQDLWLTRNIWKHPTHYDNSRTCLKRGGDLSYFFVYHYKTYLNEH